ncbi:MAG: hypothetical protein LBQ66_15080 [Planctomycetaceae bacterium]|nr:hypothetical protein [Planctomycetaceae bacterium]
MVLICVFFAFWFRDVLIRWQLCSVFSRQTGCVVGIDIVRSNFGQGEFTIDQFRLSGGNLPNSKNASVRADKIYIKGSPSDILQRYIHLPEVRVEGLQISIPTPDAGQFIPDKMWSELKNQSSELLTAVKSDKVGLIELLGSSPEEVTLQYLRQLETFKLAEELSKKWSADSFNNFNNDASILHERCQSIQNRIAKFRNGDGNIGDGVKLIKELEESYKLLRRVVEGSEQLRQVIHSDCRKLSESALKDQQVVRAGVGGKLDVVGISEALIGGETRSELSKIMAWGGWASSIVEPVEMENNLTKFYERFGLSPPKRFKGETIRFASIETRPEFLVDRLGMTGAAYFGNVPVYFNCELSNIAVPMRLGSEPLAAQICFSGSGIAATPNFPVGDDVNAIQVPAVFDQDILPNVYVTLSINRTGTASDDRLIIRCPRYNLPERILGDTDKFAINISPGISAIDAVLTVNGEQIEGEVRITQSNVQLNLIKPKNGKQLRHETELNQILNSIKDFTMSIKINGLRNNPSYTFKSNLSDSIIAELEVILTKEFDIARAKINDSIVAANNETTNNLLAAIKDKVEPVLQKMKSDVAELDGQLADINKSSNTTDILLKQALKNLLPTTNQTNQNQTPTQNTEPPKIEKEKIEKEIKKGFDKLLDKIKK